MRKCIVVTGGSKGIGRAVVEKFLMHDFDVVACGRNGGDLEAMQAAMAGAHPNEKVSVFVADLSVKSEAKKFTDFVNERVGVPDVLVNNAGYFIPGAVSTEPDGTLEQMVAANLYSAYYTTRGLVQGMMDKRAGHIFNMCSIASLQAYPNGGSYAIVKAALLSFSRNLREEMKPHNVRVTAVMPGATRTQSWDGVDVAEDRLMKPEDVAEMIYASYSLSGRSVVEEMIIRPMLGDL